MDFLQRRYSTYSRNKRSYVLSKRKLSKEKWILHKTKELQTLKRYKRWHKLFSVNRLLYCYCFWLSFGCIRSCLLITNHALYWFIAFILFSCLAAKDSFRKVEKEIDTIFNLMLSLIKSFGFSISLCNSPFFLPIEMLNF